MASLYSLLFGKEKPADGNVIDFAEHGRVGGLSTGQGFKYSAIIDPVSGTSPTVTGGKLDVNAAISLGNVTLSGADGKILDASNASLSANVFDLSNKKALATALVDANGDQITSFGSALATVTVIQGNSGSGAWLVTLATLPVVASGTITANAGTNLNTSALALESGGNLASILSKLDVSLGSRLASGSTLPITGTITATQGGLWGVNISAMPAVSIDTTGLATETKQDTGNTSLSSILAKLDVNLGTRLASGSTLPITGNVGQIGTWLMTLATLPVVASGTVTANAGTNLNTSLLALESGGNLATIAGKDFATQTSLAAVLAKLDVSLGSRLASGSTLPITGTVTANQGGLWGVNISAMPPVTVDTTGLATETKQDTGNTSLSSILAKLDVNLSTRLASGSTLPVVGNLGAAGGSLTVYQGTNPWQVTLATLPVIASGTITANAGTNLNTSLLALESGGNLATIAGKDFATQTTLASILSKLDVNLSTRLASGSTLPITGTVSAMAAGGSLTVYQGGGAWLATLATLPVIASIPDPVAVTGTFWQATQPVSGTVAVTQSGTWDEVGINDSGNSITVDNAQLSVVGTGTEATAMRVTIASDSTGVLSVDDNGGALTVDGTVTANLAAGTNNIGDIDVLSIAAGDNNIGNVDVVTLPATPAGTNAIGKLLPPDIDVTTHTNYAKKYYTNAGAVTDGIVWSPAAGKRWHVTFLYIGVSAAATVTLEDDLAAGDSAVWKHELAANSGIAIPFPEKYPLASGEDAADLIVTTTAGNVYITCVGYEV